MTVRDVLQKDPLHSELLNNGVAEVRDVRDPSELRTLRYELETFVCEGQYQQGLSRILHTYLQNLDKPAQPAAWISGFFGSGKSHLAKMLRALWTDFPFSDGARARGIAKLPDEIQDLLKELSTAGKRYGGLHAASGTLSAGTSDSVRLAFLGIIFRSVGLPEKYPFARFVLWLREQGVEDQVRAAVEARGKTFERELANLYVSTTLASALIDSIPDFANTPADALRAIEAQFPNVKDVSNDDVFRAVYDTLANDGQLPCTLVVLDEVQQYIGENRDRSIDVQELAEFCCNKFHGKLLLVATGQAALSGAALLQRLQARFKVSVMLSDTDVEAVIRKIVLAKRPDRIADVARTLDEHSGEIARHLAGTRIGYTAADEADLVRDYPLLPVRRRFWERALRAVDRAGTAGQLRTQLRVVYEAVKDVAERPLGWVVPADYLYDQLDHELLSTGVLLRVVRDDIIEKQRDGSPDGQLRARLCALIYLIGKLPREQGADAGIRATPEMLADLMVEDLNEGSASLRQRIPPLLAELAQKHFLMQVEGEFRLQTKESQAWNNDFRIRYEQYVGDDQRMEHERADRIRSEATSRFGSIRIAHGKSNVQRRVQLEFGRGVPHAEGQNIPIWIRDGWQDSETTVLNDARRLGTSSPVVLAYVPKRSADELRKSVAELLAAGEVLQVRPAPNTAEGTEAREAMVTRKRDAQTRVNSALETIFSGTQVILAGGDSYPVIPPEAAVEDAAKSALVRLFPQFDTGNDPKWANVVTRAKAGDGGALEAVGYKDDVDKNAVCKAVLQEVGAGKKGSDLRKTFTSVPYGWPQDTVDGAIMILHLTGHLRASQNGAPVGAKQLDQSKIGPTDFRTESVFIGTSQKLALRGLFQQAGISCQPGDESARATDFVRVMMELAARAGGNAPAPASPSMPKLVEIRGMSGNDQLLALYEERDTLQKAISTWKSAEQRIGERMPRWNRLQELLRYARGLPVADDVAPQAEAILNQRLLLQDPDPVPALCDQLTGALRKALGTAADDYRLTYETQARALEQSDAWQRIGKSDRARIFGELELSQPPNLSVGSEDDVVRALERASLDRWAERRDALQSRFGKALEAAVKLLTPKARKITLQTATLSSESDVDGWIEATRAHLLKEVAAGPVIL